MKKILALSLGLLCVCSMACQPVRPIKKPAALGSSVVVREVGNFHMVTPGIMRSQQPKDETFALLKNKAGVRTVINLRNEKDQIEKERVIVEGLGMKYISVPMTGNSMVTPQRIAQILAEVADPKNQPVLVHCAAGKDRTGMVMASFRIGKQGWSVNDAIQEMLLYGYDRGCCANLEKSLKEWAAGLPQNITVQP